MASSLKSQSQLSQKFSGLQVPDSSYGQCVPYAFGHCRLPHKLIYWNNFRAGQQGGKKGGKGAQTVYTVNADMLLGYGPFEGLGSIWQNQSWQYVSYHSAVFNGVGTASNFTFAISPSSTFIMVMGVALEVAFTASFNDYGGFGITRTFGSSGSSLKPLYNGLFAAPNYGTFATTGAPYATYNSSYGNTSVTVFFPAPVTNPSITIYWIENGGNDQPQNPTGGKKGGGGIPVQIPGLTFERHLGAGPSGQPITYLEFSGVGGANIPLGGTPVLPYFNYEVKALFGLGNTAPVASFDPGTGGYDVTTTSGDCCPADIIADLICSGNVYDYNSATIWHHGLGFSSYVATSNKQNAYSRYGGILADEPNTWSGGNNLGLNAMRDYCMAYGIFISGCVDAQQSAADLLDEISKVANCAPVWDGAALDFIPYCEVSAYGNGTQYDAPTALGPIFNLTEKDFLPQSDKSLFEQVGPDRPTPNLNSLQVGFKDATQQFNDNFVLISDSMDIMVQGPAPGAQETYSYITSSKVAQSVGWSRLRRALTINRKAFNFSLPTYWEVILTPMDLITIFDPSVNRNPIPVRIKTIDISVDEDGKRKLDLTAEPFIYGGSAPLPAPSTGPSVINTGGTGGSNPPGDVNPPIFIETVPGLNTSGPQLWICVSGAGQFYGGCAIWLSVDGGATYTPNPIGFVFGRQTMGQVYSANYPLLPDPDNTNTLDVDLTESFGVLSPMSSTAQNNLASLWYLEGGGTLVINGQTLTIPYELGAYQGASLLAANKYGLTPPNRRGMLNTPVAAHPIGSDFSYLLDGLVFKMNLAASMIGQPLAFKFTAFNQTQGNQQDLSSVAAYSFTPTGLVGWTYDDSGTGGTTTTGTPAPDFANDLYMYVPGTYGSSQELWSAEPARTVTLPIGLANSPIPTCDVAPTGAVSIPIYKVSAGVPTAVGSLDFAPAATTGTKTFPAAVTLNGTGDYLAVFAPVTVDATFAGLRFTFWATRGSGGTGGGGTAPVDSVQLINSSQTVGFAGATNTLIKATAGVGGITATLISAIGVAGQRIRIFKADAAVGAITVATSGGQTISGAASLTLTNQWQFLQVESDNANWIIIASN